MSDRAKLSQMRIAEAVSRLNEALRDAHRMGLRTNVFGDGDYEKRTVKVVIMNPVEIRMQEQSQ